MNTKIINYSNIAKEINSNVSNVKNYFEVLEDTLLGFKLESFHLSVRKRQNKAPKCYWFDVGVVRSLQNYLSVPLISSTSYYGDIFESFIVNQIKTILEYRVEQFQL